MLKAEFAWCSLVAFVGHIALGKVVVGIAGENKCIQNWCRFSLASKAEFAWCPLVVFVGHIGLGTVLLVIAVVEHFIGGHS